MLLYLDLNCFNRPFDDQTQARVAEETAAVYRILQRIVSGSDRLAWSEALGYENSQHPLADRRAEIATWASRAVLNVRLSTETLRRADLLTRFPLSSLDAAHLA